MLGPSFDFGWAFHNPGTFLKVVAVVLAVCVVIVLWFAEQIGDFRRRLTQGFAILRDRRAYLRGVALWQGSTGRCGSSAVLFFLQRVRAPGDRAQRAARPGLGGARVAPADQPVRDRNRAGVPALPVRDQASRTALLAFSVGMRITLIVVNIALGFAALFITLRTVHWRQHGATTSTDPDTR